MKEYINYFIAACFICIAALFLGGKPSSIAEVPISPETTPVTGSAASTVETEVYAFWLQLHEAREADAEVMESKCRQAAELCQSLFLNAEMETSPYFPNDTTLTQNAVDGIEALLADEGYPVVNTDSKYPSYLENSGSLAGFFRSMENNENAQQDVVYVSKYGLLQFYTFCYEDGERYCVHGSASFDENGEIVIAAPQESPILDIGLTYNGYLYYQLQPLNNHGEAITSLLVEPVDQTLYDLNAQYILPIHYQSNNLFLLDWDSSNYGYMCFNDLLEYLYFLQHDRYFDSNPYPFDDTLRACRIPAQEFEATILPYFDVSLENFRAATLYDVATDTYPWQRSGCMNLTFFPPLTPSVSGYRDNDDGTITITVDVLCFDLAAFPLFTHEVTVRPHDDGNFQYLSNTITYKSGIGFPNANPRITDQQPTV